MEDNFWFDGYPGLSHNCLFTFFQSMRGPGKTFWGKCWAFSDFIKNSKQFLWIRRYRTELKELKNFPAQVAYKFEGHEIVQKGFEIFIDKKLAGKMLALSTQITVKGNNFKDVNKIIYDEFQLPKGHYHYLPNEVETFFNLYETVNRLRMRQKDEVRAVFLGNFEGYNPYFDYFNINLDKVHKYKKKEYIYAERWYNENYVKAKESTRFGKMIAGTNYGDYAIRGERFDRDEDMIAARPKDSIFWYNISTLGKIYGVWGSRLEKKLVISKANDPFAKTFCLSRPDVKGGMELILPRDIRIKSLAENYRYGMVYYESPDIKNNVSPALARLCYS